MIHLCAVRFLLYSYPFMSYVVLVVTPVIDFLGVCNPGALLYFPAEDGIKEQRKLPFIIKA